MGGGESCAGQSKEASSVLTMSRGGGWLHRGRGSLPRRMPTGMGLDQEKKLGFQTQPPHATRRGVHTH